MSAEPLHAGGALPRIMVVDDVPMFVELETLFLSRHGEVSNARSGEEALALMAEWPADVAVIDLHLPDMGGDQLLVNLREASGNPDLPVVLVSNGAPEEHALAVRAGATDVISKPLCRTELVSAVSRMLVPGGPRGLPRIPVDRPVRFRSESHWQQGTIRNLSRGGIFLESEVVSEAGTELSLEFDLNDPDTSFSTTAKAVWSQPGSHAGMGLRFLDLDGETLRRLDGYVHERYRPSLVEGWQGAPS